MGLGSIGQGAVGQHPKTPNHLQKSTPTQSLPKIPTPTQQIPLRAAPSRHLDLWGTYRIYHHATGLGSMGQGTVGQHPDPTKTPNHF